MGGFFKRVFGSSHEGKPGPMDPGEMASLAETMAQRLVAEYAPERVVLIPADLVGDSDAPPKIDFLVVKETSDGFDERRRKVLQILASVHATAPAEALVLTPTEAEDRLRRGDYLLSEVMRYGKVLHPEPEE